MTLSELGEEYARTARMLRERIRLAEAQAAEEETEAGQRQQAYRLRLLRSMWRDTRAVADHLTHYYERGDSKREDHVL